MIDETPLHIHARVPIVLAPIMYFIRATLSTSLILRRQFSDLNLASLYARPDRKHVDEVFLLLPTSYSSAALHSVPPPSSHDIFYIPVYLFLLHFYPFAILNPDTPTTKIAPTPPRSTHSKQSKRSSPSTIPRLHLPLHLPSSLLPP